MPEFFINGEALPYEDGQTVMQAARKAGHYIPALCWHPQLSVPGNCRICVVEVEGDGGGWLDIACNMPVTRGMRVLTESDKVRARRRDTMQFITLNHPVDCGICDKAGECTLQDYHFGYNGGASISREAKVHATKHFDLSARIVLDNERCILCTRCVRFTREVSKSKSLGVIDRGDHSLIRPTEDGAFARDAYSDNVIDICPVGALLSRRFLHQSRVWYLQATPSVCPGCERGCEIDIWHRKPEWAYQSLDAKFNTRIERVTPRARDAMSGENNWVCNKARDLADTFGRARACQPMLKGRVVAYAEALTQARELLATARQPVALLSSWASNEELAAFTSLLGSRFTQRWVKTDSEAQPGEVVQDEFLILPDKNPNSAGARAIAAPLPADAATAFPAGCDLVLVWGEGCRFTTLPRGARIVHLNSWLQPENGHADVFVPISTMLERAGHYTNAQGGVGAFAACFARPAGVVDAASFFADWVGSVVAVRGATNGATPAAGVTP